MLESFIETLNKKSEARKPFQCAMCKDDWMWMDMELLHSWFAALDAWCEENGYSLRFLKPTNPITIDGKEYENHRMNKSLVDFVPNELPSEPQFTSAMLNEVVERLKDSEL